MPVEQATTSGCTQGGLQVSLEAEHQGRHWYLDDNQRIYVRSDSSNELEGWDGSESGPQPPDYFLEGGRPGGVVPEGGAVEGYESVLERFDTENPFLLRLFDHELYGQVPDGCRGLLEQLTTSYPDEKYLTAIRVRHGRQNGYLMITTRFMRYVRAERLMSFMYEKKDEMWSLEYDITAEGRALGVIETSTGHLFQIWGLKAKKFTEFHRLAQHSLAWEAEREVGERHSLRDAAAATALGQQPASHGSLAAELAELAQLRNDGVLSEEEFAAAKRKLLGP